MTNIDQQLKAPGVADGNHDAGGLLVRAFNELRDELVSTLLFVLGNREDAQDAAQEAFIKCWAARDKLGEVVNLRAYIFRVCFNTAKDVQRSAYKRRVKPLRGEEFMIAHNTPPPGQALEFTESVERLRKAILALRIEEKEIFLLRQNGELTYEQIAEMRSVPVGTVKTQMRNAVEKLRKLLN
ncbi:MAG TPA: RNA polymerase sigma factor [Gemmataceae bacterium]|nr:RNA polymerase sigma factor [Gemmataceae bacterium]